MQDTIFALSQCETLVHDVQTAFLICFLKIFFEFAYLRTQDSKLKLKSPLSLEDRVLSVNLLLSCTVVKIHCTNKMASEECHKKLLFV